MLDYLRTCGEKSLTELPLNDVDRLIFAQLAYLDLRGATPHQSLSGALAQAAFDTDADASEMRFPYQHKDDRQLCALLTGCTRYEGVTFESFRSAYQPDREQQFAALVLRLPDGAVHIAYRGTDITLAGWKEDFNLAFMDEIPSQTMGCQLAEELAPDAPRLELCGHSKGGNLALYAAVSGSAELRSRLRCVVSFDGPGLSRQLAESPAWQALQGRMRLISPTFSLLGTLFHQPEDVRIVESRAIGPAQHYPYSWKTDGADFAYAPRRSRPGQTLGDIITVALAQLPPPTRERFVEAVYAIIASTGAQTASDLLTGWVHNARAMLRQLRATDKETYRLMLHALGTFFRAAAEVMGLPLTEHLTDHDDTDDA
ncbi:MAG: Mbeg1-like protein [Aristaeellaceae bacterium]